MPPSFRRSWGEETPARQIWKRCWQELRGATGRHPISGPRFWSLHCTLAQCWPHFLLEARFHHGTALDPNAAPDRLERRIEFGRITKRTRLFLERLNEAL